MTAAEGNITATQVKSATGAQGPVVLQVLPALVTGGAERGTVDIAGAIIADGGTAIVASEGGPMENDLKRLGALHLKLPLASKNPLVIHRNVTRLARVIESYKVDLVHARSRAPAWSARAAARRTGCHFVTTFHAPYNFSNALKKRYNAVMADGERVIAISEFIAEHVRTNYKIDPKMLRVIHRGVDLARFDPDRVSAERMIQLSTRWRLADGQPLILMPGRLTRWKGQAVLLEALSKLRDIEYRCVLVGSDQGRTAYRRELEELINQHGLAGRVSLLDECSDMPAAYMLSDVVVSASTDPEGFGRIVGEAQALGRPVVASDHGGAREQLLAERTGFLFPSGNAEALAGSLRKALGLSPEARAQLHDEAIARVRQHFSKDQMCAKTLSLYKEVLRAGAWAPGTDP
ncbi:glycosyltransferase family 4 protein [Pelagibius litoralis]|uniref:Glycosyltransferase family 4 protein n=1 Tax=Pelagibius litoralis TaxID=374515 RepID=A0A967EX65_9PROT|nr:glycosyltransferase family 4 protein [Pelagibius litoralis]NIA67940.1 glycosyltransferase family 4 protein [Pelagibius litoralis]